MAKVEFGKLDNIIRDDNSQDKYAENSSVCLSQFLYVISNLSEKWNQMTESELALFSKGLQQYLNRHNFTTCRTEIELGDIFNVDFGINYEPEMSFNHPGVIIDIIGDLVLVVPTSTSKTKISKAYHPTDNPSGYWYYYKVGKKDGFAEECVLILGNVCTISKGRLLEKKGELNNNNSLFEIIRNIILSNVFTDEYNNLNNEILRLKEENATLKEKSEKIG